MESNLPSRSIVLRNVSRRHANRTLAVHGVSLEVGPREWVSLVGPSGCGKSTLLRLIAGLDSPTAGQISTPALEAGAAQTGFVFQDATLMPWANVLDNVALPLRLAGRSHAESRPAAQTVLRSVGLGDVESSYPRELSGGMRMRASIARALVTEPRVLLMDEPFAALDEITRQRLNDDLQSWWQARDMAIVFVTHSVFEAVYLSQRVLVMASRPGRVVADIEISEPCPRSAPFRLTPAFADACRAVSQALEQASAMPADAVP
jgi:NitT/TauT family transport system ATP-binding protein